MEEGARADDLPPYARGRILYVDGSSGALGAHYIFVSRAAENSDCHSFRLTLAKSTPDGCFRRCHEA